MVGKNFLYVIIPVGIPQVSFVIVFNWIALSHV